MSYQGATYAVPLSGAGFNHNPNIDAIPFTSMIHPSRNITLHEGGVGKRGGTSKVNSTAITGGYQIMGLHDFLLENGTQFQVFATKDGKLWKNTTTTIKTGMSITKKFSFAVFKNVLYVADGETRPQTWDGAAASTSDITSIPTDWTGTNFPAQLLVHSRGLSKRMVALVFPTTKENIYLSKSDDAGDFSDANGKLLNVRTGDGFGVVGGFTFGDRLFVCGKNQSFLIDDSSADVANWGILKAAWNSGVAHHRLICKTPNDVLLMTEDGAIYSVSTAESYGDYKAANLTRPTYMDRWIRENVKLSAIDDFHCVYDPTQRCAKFFVVRNGFSTCNTALVFYIDRPLENAWAIHDNQSYNSGFSASAAAVVRTATGTYEVWSGDYSGFLWKQEQAVKSDDGNGYWAGIRTVHLHMDNPRIKKHFRRGWIVTQPEGAYNLNVRWFVDSVEKVPTTASLAGAGSVFGGGVFGTAFFGGQELLNTPYDLGEVGYRLQQELYNNVAEQDFFLSQLLVDFKPLGATPA